MDTTGFKLPSIHHKRLEVLIVLATADYIRRTISKAKELAAVSRSKSGRVRPESMPSTFLGRIVTPVHGIATAIPPLIYIVALVLNRFHQPGWMVRFSLPYGALDSSWVIALRGVACATSFALKRLEDSIFKHLGDQWHSIGRREKPRIVKTGPYGWVRHPAYSSVLLQEALWSAMFWSYVLLVALAITAFAFAIKMPIEESLIQRDDAIRDDYQRYISDVPARIIPYVCAPQSSQIVIFQDLILFWCCIVSFKLHLDL